MISGGGEGISKIIVFDLDGTLGYFTEFGLFIDSIISCNKNQLLNLEIRGEFFNKLLDLYPEFLRPNIIYILGYLKYKKLRRKCGGIIIYTNNKGPIGWCNLIINYFHKKIDFELFDEIIKAYKIDGRVIEEKRTTNKKTINDFLSCIQSKLPNMHTSNLEICFIDDDIHPKMVEDNVFYVKMNKYKFSLSYELMVERFIQNMESLNITGNKEDCSKFIHNYLLNSNYKHKEKSNVSIINDEEYSKRIALYLQTFFDSNWRISRKDSEEDLIISNKISSDIYVNTGLELDIDSENEPPMILNKKNIKAKSSKNKEVKAILNRTRSNSKINT